VFFDETMQNNNALTDLETVKGTTDTLFAFGA
jgi:hypothetical protein